MNESTIDPYRVLGVEVGCTPEDARSVYLSLVRQFPPEREPDKFRQIHSAYEMIRKPLVQAQAIMSPKGFHQDLAEVISSNKNKLPQLPVLVLLALGNQE
jgi:curved DNA-binding protein CbpA